MEFIEKLQPRPEKKVLIKMIQEKFNISQSTIYSIYNKVLITEKKSVSTLLGELEEKKYLIREFPDLYSSDRIYPDILILSNEEMKENFRKYGDCVSFDLTFSLFRDNPVHIES